MSGDRDFTPLVQSLRKRGKCVIGVGIKHTTSSSLVELCDQYIFYEDLIPLTDLSQANVEELLALARDDLLQNKKQARASLLKQKMMNLSKGTFDRSAYPESSFRKFLQQYPEIVQLRQEGSTTYIAYPLPSQSEKPLHLRYRSALKKQRVRIIPAHQRFIVLKDLIHLLSEDRQLLWREVLSALAANYENNSDNGISKNMINAVMLVSRQANVIRTLKGRSLSTAPVLLGIKEGRIFQQAVIRIDGTYLQAIQDLPDPFDLSEATLALYDSTSYMPYLGRVFNSLDALKAN
jgi:hypothetical protein